MCDTMPACISSMAADNALLQERFFHYTTNEQPATSPQHFLPCISLASLLPVLQGPTGDELLLVFPVSKLLDILKFPDNATTPTPQPDPDIVPYVRLVQDTD